MSNAKPIAAIPQTSQPVSVSRPEAVIPDAESAAAAAMQRPSNASRKKDAGQAASLPARGAKAQRREARGPWQGGRGVVAHCGPIEGGHVARKSRGPRVV